MRGCTQRRENRERDRNKCVAPNDARTHHQLSGVKIVSESEKQGEGWGEVSGPGMRERVTC